MTMVTPDYSRSHGMAHLRRRKADHREFRLIFAATFALFLILALIGRLMPRDRRPLGAAAGPARSVWGEARAAAYATIPFAFMG